MSIASSLTLTLTIQVHDDGRVTYSIDPPPDSPALVRGALPAGPVPADPPGLVARELPVLVAPDVIAAITAQMSATRKRMDRQFDDAMRKMIEDLGDPGAGPRGLDNG